MAQFVYERVHTVLFVFVCILLIAMFECWCWPSSIFSSHSHSSFSNKYFLACIWLYVVDSCVQVLGLIFKYTSNRSLSSKHHFLQVVILLTFVLTVGLWNFLSWVGLLVVGKRERITDQIIGKWGLQLCSNPCYRVFVYWPREARLNHTIDIRKKEAKITEIAYVTKRWLHPKMLSHLREQQTKIHN